MDWYSLLAEFVFTIGLTLGVGSSTFALTFYIAALTDGIIDHSEKRLMHIVYTVLRIGMFLIALGLAASFFFGTPFGPSLQYLVQWALLIIIALNAILMTIKIMPMRYGPTLAGGSWYSLFFASTLPIWTLPPYAVIGGYIAVLICLHTLLQYLQRKHCQRPTA